MSRPSRRRIQQERLAGRRERKSTAVRAQPRAGAIVRLALIKAYELLAPGITTGEIDVELEKLVLKHDAVPTNKGYKGYPAATCISPNDVVAHGIPGDYELQDGDIVTVDLGVTFDGMHADACRTFPVGDVSPAAQSLIETSELALSAAMVHARAGVRTGDLGYVIQNVTEQRGFAVVREFCGHGIGREYHTKPFIPNFGIRRTGDTLSPGMAIAIEPIICAGDPEIVYDEDGWTARTRDGSRAAASEHTVLIRPSGPPLILT